MIIRPLAPRDVVGVVVLWNECVRDGEVVYAPITPDSFHQKFELDPNYDPRFSLVAEEDAEVQVHGDVAHEARDIRSHIRSWS